MTTAPTPLGAISAVRTPVRDLARARGFFRDVLGLSETFAGEEIAIYATGEASLVLEPTAPDDEAEVAIGAYRGVMFAVADAAAAHAWLKARGVDVLAPPEAMGWGGVFVHFRDPDGNVFSACQYPDRV